MTENNDTDILLENRRKNRLSFQKMLKMLHEIKSNSIFLYSCTVIVFMLFQVAVFIFWGTTYFEVVVGLDKNLAMISVGLVCVSAPVFGVILGGLLYDRMAKEGSKLEDYFRITLITLLISAVFVNSFTLLQHNVVSIMFVWLGVAFGTFMIFNGRSYVNAYYDYHHDRKYRQVCVLFR